MLQAQKSFQLQKRHRDIRHNIWGGKFPCKQHSQSNNPHSKKIKRNKSAENDFTSYINYAIVNYRQSQIFKMLCSAKRELHVHTQHNAEYSPGRFLGKQHCLGSNNQHLHG